jgi:hypothetical protein
MFESNGAHQGGRFPFAPDTSGQISVSAQDLLAAWQAIEKCIELYKAAAEEGVSVFKDIRDHIRQLTSEVRDLRAEVRELKELEKQTQNICAQQAKVLTSLAEENRSLRDKDMDRRVTVAYALDIITMLERHEVEISEAEQGTLQFGQLERCRAVDQKQAMAMLQRLGVEEIRIRRGAEPNDELHDVIRTRPTIETRKHGRISQMLRRGYRRRHDGLLILPALVEVWGPVAASV